MFRTLFYCVVFIAFHVTSNDLLAAQADYYIGDTLELPTLGSRDADHAVIAVNSYGDVIVVNHTSVGAHSKAIEVNILVPAGPGIASGLQLFPTYLLGDPTLDIYQFGGDSCNKPDAEALSDDSFLVVWARHELSNRHPSRIEGCRISTRNSYGVLLAQPIIATKQVGEGYIIDETSTAGAAGFMPDIAPIPGSDQNAALVVFAHEQSSITRPSTTYREYDLRCIKIDWATSSSAPNLGTLATLSTDIPFDNNNSQPYFGGMILPDATIDDGNNLIVAFEEFLIKPHYGYVGDPKGTITVQRFSGSPLTLIDDIEFSGHRDFRHQRRPMVATSQSDNTNKVMLGWVEKDDSNTIIHRAHFRTFIFNQNGSGYTDMKTLPWDESFGIEDDLPAVAISGRTQFILTSRSFPNKFKLTSAYKSTQSSNRSTQITTSLNYPWRPAAALLDFANFSMSYICFEGADVHDPNQYKVHLTIQSLD